MRILIDPSLMPPTGFFYVDRDTGYKTEAGTLSTLIREATRHRKGNKLPVPDNFAAIVEDFICLNNDPDFSKGTAESSFNVPLTESWIRSAMQAFLLHWKRNGQKFVEEMEANRRAEVCVHCQHNVRSPICFSCVGLDTMQASYFSRPTPLDAQLRVCKLLAIPNESLVHVHEDSILIQEKEFPDTCWYRLLSKGTK